MSFAIMHRPSASFLDGWGHFHPGICFGMGQHDTLMYRHASGAARRMRCQKPGKRIPDHILKDCVVVSMSGEVPVPVEV